MLIAPPKTYANISTNMTGWIVTSDSVSGSRRIRAMLRLVSTQTSLRNWVNTFCPVARSAGDSVAVVIPLPPVLVRSLRGLRPRDR